MYFHIGSKSNTVVRDPDAGQDNNHASPERKTKTQRLTFPHGPA